MDGLRVLEDRHYVKWIKEFGYGVYSLTNSNDSYVLLKLGQPLSDEDYNELEQPFVPAINSISLNMRILVPDNNTTASSNVEPYVLTAAAESGVLSPLHLFSAVIEYMKLIRERQTDIFFIGIYELNAPPSYVDDMQPSQIFIDYGIRASTSNSELLVGSSGLVKVSRSRVPNRCKSDMM